MADHTIQFQHVIDALDKTITYESVTIDGVTYGSLPVLTGGEPIGLEGYPIHSEPYRKVLNGKIVDQYFLNEIGHESIGVFVHRLRVKMNEIMPLYSKMYQDITFDEAMRTTDITTTARATSLQSADTSSEAETASTGKTGSRTVNLDFPQTALAGDSDYATSGVDANGLQESGGTSTETGTQSTEGETESESRSFGRAGSAVDALMAYRASQMNVDRLILDELRVLFMGVYGTGDEFLAPALYPRY